MSSCQVCGQHGPVLEVHYRQNTGMLFMRQSKDLHAELCRECSSKYFLEMTLHTAILGWWGTISFIVTPFFLLGNIYHFFRTQRMPKAAVARRARLEDQREYARALLEGKDPRTVVEVLMKNTGAPQAEVEAFVRSCAAPPSNRP